MGAIMRPMMTHPTGETGGIHDLIHRLESLREEMLRFEAGNLARNIHPRHRPGARNLLHYVALRRHDIRQMQQQLAELGLSSLGRTESNVMNAIRAVLRALVHLSSQGPTSSPDEGHGMLDGRKLLEENTEALLGPPPSGRRVRIMVTMPSDAATDYNLVHRLLAAGMNCMRINCAHDGPRAWARMIRNLRKAQKALGMDCKVQMDLAGPKLRTGPVASLPGVLKYRPKRDHFGCVTAPARVLLTTPDHLADHPEGGLVVPMDPGWIARLRTGDLAEFEDTRGAHRTLHIREEAGPSSWWAEAFETGYIAAGVEIALQSKAGKRTKRAIGRVGPLPPAALSLHLKQGDVLILTRSLEPGRSAVLNAEGEVLEPARIGVTLPEFFDVAQPGDPIWLDDGAIGGVIGEAHPDHVSVRILQARPGGDKLGAEKGINLPGRDLPISPLTADDLKILKFVAQHADIVGFSFVKAAADVRDLRRRLTALGRKDLGIVLKIETRQAFDNLPSLLMEAMRGGPVGVMIARGDLAVECGFERLAEIQEEILWISEAAHVPVVWATQVLETLAKTGRPSRSEITDAAMGERAECVMLNKGPFVVEAVQVLDDILGRMESHQEKKTSMLRKLSVASSFDSGDDRTVPTDTVRSGTASCAAAP
jgi:pyruvate kinase